MYEEQGLPVFQLFAVKIRSEFRWSQQLRVYKYFGLTWEAPEKRKKKFPHMESHSCMKIGEMVDSINSREKIGK